MISIKTDNASKDRIQVLTGRIDPDTNKKEIAKGLAAALVGRVEMEDPGALAVLAVPVRVRIARAAARVRGRQGRMERTARPGHGVRRARLGRCLSHCFRVLHRYRHRRRKPSLTITSGGLLLRSG